MTSNTIMKDGNVHSWDEIDLCLKEQFGYGYDEWIRMLFDEAIREITIEIAMKQLKKAGLIK